MIAPDLMLMRRPDGSTHYSAPGCVAALCGAERLSNADVMKSAAVPSCAACVRLAEEAAA